MKKILLVTTLIFIGVFALSIISINAAPIGPLVTNTNPDDPCDFIAMFITAKDVILGLSGVFATVMFVYGGMVMVTAYGNEARIKWGKDILVAAVVGIFVVLLAWTGVNTLLQAIDPDSPWSTCPEELSR